MSINDHKLDIGSRAFTKVSTHKPGSHNNTTYHGPSSPVPLTRLPVHPDITASQRAAYQSKDLNINAASFSKAGAFVPKKLVVKIDSSLPVKKGLLEAVLKIPAFEDDYFKHEKEVIEKRFSYGSAEATLAAYFSIYNQPPPPPKSRGNYRADRFQGPARDGHELMDKYFRKSNYERDSDKILSILNRVTSETIQAFSQEAFNIIAKSALYKDSRRVLDIVAANLYKKACLESVFSATYASLLLLFKEYSDMGIKNGSSLVAKKEYLEAEYAQMSASDPIRYPKEDYVKYRDSQWTIGEYLRRSIIRHCQLTFNQGDQHLLETYPSFQLGPDATKATLDYRSNTLREFRFGNIRFSTELIDKNLVSHKLIPECLSCLLKTYISNKLVEDGEIFSNEDFSVDNLDKYENIDYEYIESACNFILRLKSHGRREDDAIQPFKYPLQKVYNNPNTRMRIKFLIEDAINLIDNGLPAAQVKKTSFKAAMVADPEEITKRHVETAFRLGIFNNAQFDQEVNSLKTPENGTVMINQLLFSPTFYYQSPNFELYEKIAKQIGKIVRDCKIEDMLTQWKHSKKGIFFKNDPRGIESFSLTTAYLLLNYILPFEAMTEETNVDFYFTTFNFMSQIIVERPHYDLKALAKFINDYGIGKIATSINTPLVTVLNKFDELDIDSLTIAALKQAHDLITPELLTECTIKPKIIADALLIDKHPEEILEYIKLTKLNLSSIVDLLTQLYVDEYAGEAVVQQLCHKLKEENVVSNDELADYVANTKKGYNHKKGVIQQLISA